MEDPIRPRRRWRALAGLVALATAPVAMPAAADAAPAEQHCVVDVVGQEADGRFVTSKMRCYRTYEEAMASVGVEVDPAADLAGQAQQAALLSTIGTHYDGFNLGGGSFSVNGSVCNGGWLNTTIFWANKISSSASPCTVRHFDFFGLGGSFEDTGAPWGNLSTMNNRTESLQYL